MRALAIAADAVFGPAIVIPAPIEPEGPEVLAIGVALIVGLYGCIGAYLTALALWM